VPDLPIVIPDTATAPKDYTLSGTQELALKTVRALIDGSGAATAFLPTLQLLDPNGHVMWEGATSDTVAAGASADVSWFPGLGAGGASTGVQWFFARRTTNFSVPGASLQRIPWTHFVMSDSTVFSVTTTTNANDTVHGLKAGVYLAVGQQGWTTPANYPHRAQIATDFFNIDAILSTPVSDSATDLTETGNFRLVGDMALCITQAVPGEISLQAQNFDAGAHNVTIALYAIAYFPNPVLVS
jgi:hypothetical protein